MDDRSEGSVDDPVLACSKCFADRGLQISADRLGLREGGACPNCSAENGAKLTHRLLGNLAHSFFVWGSLVRFGYGAAPRIQFNEHQTTSICVPPWLAQDIHVFERCLGVGFFEYGPRLWMVGEVEPLKDLQNASTRDSAISRIITEYPGVDLDPECIFYRIRKWPACPYSASEYDSPPTPFSGKGRLDSPGFPVMYVSSDLDVCVHECRISAEDDVYVATLSPNNRIRVLDLTALLNENHVTEFESLDMAVHMVFLAGEHAYEITREIAKSAHAAGFDGIIYPSYFSLLQHGVMPFQTVYGISHRRVPQYQPFEQASAISNLAIFGRPIDANIVLVKGINRIVLKRVSYEIQFGPVLVED